MENLFNNISYLIKEGSYRIHVVIVSVFFPFDFWTSCLIFMKIGTCVMQLESILMSHRPSHSSGG
jgi:hypothetical protein